MKNTKQLLLAIGLASQLLVIGNIVAACFEVEYGSNMQDVLSSLRLLREILSKTDLTGSQASGVSKLFRKVYKDIIEIELQRRYQQATDLFTPEVKKMLKLPKNHMLVYRGFISFKDLHVELCDLIGRPVTNTRPVYDITDPQILVNMAIDAQRVQDDNLMELFDYLRTVGARLFAIGADGQPILDDDGNRQLLTTSDLTPAQIRESLYHPSNLEAIQQVEALLQGGPNAGVVQTCSIS